MGRSCGDQEAPALGKTLVGNGRGSLGRDMLQMEGPARAAEEKCTAHREILSNSAQPGHRLHSEPWEMGLRKGRAWIPSGYRCPMVDVHFVV
jgi:hypothetical protein